MAKTDTPKQAVALNVTTDAEVSPVALVAPGLGMRCLVKVAAGVVLMNNETGIPFAPEQATPATVTVTLLRRLQDGDLTLA